jgi:class 3 adenylate cyclase
VHPIRARRGRDHHPGEVLVSSTVRDLVVGSGLRFADRGEHALRGVPDRWRTFALER